MRGTWHDALLHELLNKSGQRGASLNPDEPTKCISKEMRCAY